MKHATSDQKKVALLEEARTKIRALARVPNASSRFEALDIIRALNRKNGWKHRLSFHQDDGLDDEYVALGIAMKRNDGTIVYLY